MTASFKHFAAAALAALTLLSGAAQADEQSVRDQLMKNTGLKADSVRPAPIPGLWEVFIQDRLFYVDDKVDYVFRAPSSTPRRRPIRRRSVCANGRAKAGTSGRARMP